MDQNRGRAPKIFVEIKECIAVRCTSNTIIIILATNISPRWGWLPKTHSLPPHNPNLLLRQAIQTIHQSIYLGL
jgi:hypothetical protein